MIIPVVLAGGVGSRLWPVSRQLYPKQFASLTTGRAQSAADSTLFQATLLRLASLANRGAPMVICNEDHRFLPTQQ